jgi:hypothetical protein
MPRSAAIPKCGLKLSVGLEIGTIDPFGSACPSADFPPDSGSIASLALDIVERYRVPPNPVPLSRRDDGTGMTQIVDIDSTVDVDLQL